MKQLFISMVCIWLGLSTISVHAQGVFKGKLTDVNTKEPVSFANVWIKNTNIGCLSNLDGTFTLEYRKLSDTIMITAIGYRDYEIVARNIPKDTLKIEMIPAAYMLDMLVIRPGKNPAIPIVKKAIDNRRNNRPDAVKDVEFIEYNKLNINISGLDSTIMKSNFVRKNPQILIKINDYDDAWSVPLYFSERLTYQKRSSNAYPQIQEIVQNQYGSSFINSDITTKYITSLNTDMTFYGNLRFLSKDFISPISPQALLFYKFLLKDSIEANNTTYYRIQFRPRNAQDLAFYGYMIIEKETSVLTEIDATLQPSANLNYVKSIRLFESLQKTPQNLWFYKQHRMQVEFTPQLSQDTANNLLNTPIFAIKTTSFIVDTTQISNYLQNKVIPQKFNLTARKQVEQDTTLLQALRPDSLSSLDIITREAIEITNEIPAIKATNKMLDMFLYGYYRIGKIELGPYLYFIQSNEIEHIRINLAGRTSPQFSKTMMLGGYVGYGSRDKKIKYGAQYSIQLPTTFFGAIHFKYDQNIYRIGDYKQNLDFVRENVLVQSDDNLLTAILTQNPNKAVYFVKKTQIAYEQQLSPNIILKPSYVYSKHYNPPFYSFDTTATNPSFQVHEIGCNLRLSWKEEISNNHFRKIYIDSRYPIFHFNVVQGKYVLDNSFDWYSQFRFVAKQDILIGFGRMRYVIESGITSKPVPFPLLELHRGNETGGSGEYYFNHMKYLEFASDRFVNVFAEYGMNGFILHKIWGVRKLNLRELLTFKACWGELSKPHSQIYDLPSPTHALSVPYMEAGVGVTNFFKLIRIEYIWRINYRNHPDIQTQGLFFRFQFEF